MENKKDTLRRQYFYLKRNAVNNKKFTWLQKNKWDFLLPNKEIQRQLTEKFQLLLLSNTFDQYFNNPVLYDQPYVYVTEFKNNLVNIYVTIKDLLSELCDEIERRVSDEAISFLVFKGIYQYKSKKYELRIGAYGVPCHKLTKAIIG